MLWFAISKNLAAFRRALYVWRDDGGACLYFQRQRSNASVSTGCQP